MNPDIYSPDSKLVPIIASIPHGGEIIPEEISSKLLVAPNRNYADWYTDHLYSFLPELGIPSVVATAHRIVADVNRSFLKGVAPWPAGVVSTTSARHEELYNTLISEEELQWRLNVAHTPYHQILDQLIVESLAKFDSIVLFDLHSFGMPIPYDVVLGNKNGSSADNRILNILNSSFNNQGFSTQLNKPFSGGWIVEKFKNNPRVQAIQIEINQRIYLNPIEIDKKDWSKPPLDLKRLNLAASRLRSVIEVFLATNFESCVYKYC